MPLPAQRPAERGAGAVGDDQATAAHEWVSAARVNTTPVTRSPSRSTSTARAPSNGTAPSFSATSRIRASSSSRGTAPP